MSRDLIVRNKHIIKTPLSINDLIDESTYAFGTLDEYDRMTEFGKIGDGPVVVYDRDHIGRGVQIEESSKKQLKLSLPLPATAFDIDVLYYLAQRAAKLWGNNSIIDPDWGNRISLDDIDTQKKADYKSSISILPFKPKDSYQDGDDVKECDNYLIAYLHGENLLKMNYDAFLENVSQEKKKPFDDSHWLLSAMSEEKLVAIFNSQ